MARLINYNELKRRILDERDKIPKTLPSAIYELGIEKPNNHGNSMRGGIRIALRCLEQCQTVMDAVEVVHGRWIEHHNYFQGHYESTDYECSKCGLTRDYLGGANYCPNCGAKMDLED